MVKNNIIQSWATFGHKLDSNYWGSYQSILVNQPTSPRQEITTARSIKDQNDVSLSNEDILGRWREYYEDLLNPITSIPPMDTQEIHLEVENTTTAAEVAMLSTVHRQGVAAAICRIMCLLLADDVILLASSEKGLKHVLDRFSAVCQAGLKISTAKTEILFLQKPKPVHAASSNA